ncbi:hypothetical protein MHM93_07870 [Pseudoalteromonas sp. MM17-2]|uniref:hypothetical protein n=1 Tax=Pseudoalteromonas sp. MM17-2 TaxID=2917753 RepID=UPI001EF4D9C6|nr:hypothetical protein [Pseudoalteromonas sp. MM17-2]MCG7544097.1 hypothetical protein [Pseudoalteromonas sp. MM17-2]
MSYSFELFNMYKEQKNYSQDKQAIMDIPKLNKGALYEIKKEKRCFTAEQALFIADQLDLNKQEVIVNLGIEKSKSEEEKSVYEEL